MDTRAEDTEVIQRESNLQSIIQIARLSGKYSKQVLNRLESAGLLTREVRKAVLDGFSDYAREIEKQV